MEKALLLPIELTGQNTKPDLQMLQESAESKLNLDMFESHSF
jgi:hypothetical protein